jgi:predicted transposase/invertase (TIGR01784 family)
MPGGNPSPTVDLVFRKLFGSEENKDLLIALINSVVEPDLLVTDVVVKNPFNLAAYVGSKESIVDIKAVDQMGTWYSIEMQVHGHLFYGKRALFYAAKSYVDQLEAGRNYSALNTTIGIHFLLFNFFDDARMVRQFVFKDAETNDRPEQLSYLQLYFVEMGKFGKEWPDDAPNNTARIAAAKRKWMANRSATDDRDIIGFS